MSSAGSSVTNNFSPSLKIFSTPALSFFLLEKHSSDFRFLTQVTQVTCSKGTKYKKQSLLRLLFVFCALTRSRTCGYQPTQGLFGYFKCSKLNPLGHDGIYII